MTSHLNRLEAVEKQLKALKEGTAGREDVSKMRGDMRKLYVSWVSLVPSVLLAFESKRKLTWG